MKACKPCMVSALVILIAGGASAQNPPASNARVITVSGQGQIKARPDEVLVAFGVESFGVALDVAKQDNDQRVHKLVAMAPDFGIQAADVHLEPLRIQPSYRDQDTGKEMIGYFVRRTVEVKLTDLNRFEELMSAAIAAGANVIQGVNFRTRDAAGHQEQARTLAIRDARARAESLAKELGLRIGRPASINEAYTGSYCAYNAGWGNVSWGGGEIANQVIIAAKDGWPGGYALGTVQLTATVTVTFELEG